MSFYRLPIQRSGKRQHTVTVDALTRSTQRDNGTGQPTGFDIVLNSREAKLLPNGMAYLRPGPFYNYLDTSRSWDNQHFKTFIDEAFESFLDADTETLIIDLRRNPGGDSSFSDHMVAWIADEPFQFTSVFLIRSSPEAEASNAARFSGNPDAAAGPSGLLAQGYAETPFGEQFSFEIPFASPREGERFEGHVYVLISRHSYSQAANAAATFQDYGFGIVAGEPTSDFVTTYGSLESFTLPNTGPTVNFPKAHIIRPSDDRAPAGVTPDLVIPSPITPQADDVVLQRLINDIVDRRGG